MLELSAESPLPQQTKATWKGKQIPLLKRLEIDATATKIKVIFGSGNAAANAAEPLPLEYLDPERAAGGGPASLADLTGEQPVEYRDMSSVQKLIKARDEIMADMRSAGFDVKVELIQP